jgi:hypothetical protein
MSRRGHDEDTAAPESASDSGVLLAPSTCQQEAAAEMDEHRQRRVDIDGLLPPVTEQSSHRSLLLPDRSSRATATDADAEPRGATCTSRAAARKRGEIGRP